MLPEIVLRNMELELVVVLRTPPLTTNVGLYADVPKPASGTLFLTSNTPLGPTVPIPTFPSDVIRNLSIGFKALVVLTKNPLLV